MAYVEYSKGGRFRVYVDEDDNSIDVLQTNWLSKYSEAMHGNFNFVKNFGRRRTTQGPITRIRDSNLIYAGETIYYIGKLPSGGRRVDTSVCIETKKKAVVGGTPRIEIPEISGLSSEKKNNAMWWSRMGAGATQVLAIPAYFAGPLAAGVFGVFGAILSPIMAIAGLINARSQPERFFGLRGIPYAITAWSFTPDGLSSNWPIYTPQMKSFYSTGHLSGQNLQDRINGASKQFNECVNMIANELPKAVSASGSLTSEVREFYRMMGDNNEQRLAVFLLEALAKEMGLSSTSGSSKWTGQRATNSSLFLFSPKPNYPIL